MAFIPGSNALIDGWLGLEKASIGRDPQYKHRSTLQKLSCSPFRGKPFNVAQRLFSEVEKELAERSGLPGKSNFRFRTKDNIGTANKSIEVTLERAIVAEAARKQRSDIGNMMPVASGVFTANSRKRAAVDLIELSESRLSLIELKATTRTDTPLSAAFEVLVYGLCYVAARGNPKTFGCSESEPVFAYPEVKLVVLAPLSYYDKYGDSGHRWIAEFSNRLNEDLWNLKKPIRSGHSDYRMNFEFQQFPADFTWPGDAPLEAFCSRQALQTADRIGSTETSACRTRG